MWSLERYNINFSSVTDFLSNRGSDLSRLLDTISRENISNKVSMIAPYMTRELMLGSVLGLSALYCFHNALKSESHEGDDIAFNSIKTILKDQINKYVKDEDKAQIDDILQSVVEDNKYSIMDIRANLEKPYALNNKMNSLVIPLFSAFNGKLIDGTDGDTLKTVVDALIDSEILKQTLKPKEEKKEGVQHPYAFKAFVMMPFAWKGFSTDANQIYDGFVNSAAIEKFLTFALPTATLCFAWNKDSRSATHLVTGYMLGVNCEFAAKAMSSILHTIEWPFKKICGAGKPESEIERA